MSVLLAQRAADNWLMPVGRLMRMFAPRAWIVAVVATVAALFVIGVPTRMINNPFFIRMTPVRTQDYMFWAISAPLIGLIAGSFLAGRGIRDEGKVFSGGLLSYLAVGCPICNKVVVLLIGTSGALTFFAPAQLFIGIGSIVLLAGTLVLRARSITRPCQLEL